MPTIRHRMSIEGRNRFRGDFYDAVFLFIAVLPSALAIMVHFAEVYRRQILLFVLMTGFAAGTDLAVASTKWWFPHYFQLWLPALCVSLGWSYILLGDIFGQQTRLNRLLPHIGVSFIAFWRARTATLSGESSASKRNRADDYRQRRLILFMTRQMEAARQATSEMSEIQTPR
jgi:hypothetical protein